MGLYQFLDTVEDTDVYLNCPTPIFDDWEDELASDIEAALSIAINLVEFWTVQHLISPGQLELFSTEDFCRDSQGQPA